MRLRPQSKGSQSEDVITARQAVVSNASLWDTQKLLRRAPEADSWRREAAQTPSTDSFMHLHLGEPDVPDALLAMCTSTPVLLKVCPRLHQKNDVVLQSCLTCMFVLSDHQSSVIGADRRLLAADTGHQCTCCAGIDARGLPEDLQGHHLVVNHWNDLAAPQNVCIISIPTQFDPALAPEGKGVVHAYVAANEPWDVWGKMDRKSQQYKDLKASGHACQERN